ncbi:MAG: phosphorylase [Cyanobacteria bacterium]|nr:phosphorylase [Cyanobacteriota bacterium]
MDSAPTLTSDTLWAAAQQTTVHAIACGALQSINTEFTLLEAGGIRFLVRILANIARKEAAAKRRAQQAPQGKPHNPFLPYEPDLFVGHVSDTHLCLLNKFNVVDHHLLLVTRHYESQDTWLKEVDFAALAVGLGAIPGLGFYNGGHIAGASQHHKHLQLVPLPFAAGDPLPIDTLIAQQGHLDPHQPCPLPVPFHAIAIGLPVDWTQPAPAIAPLLWQRYRQLLAYLGLDLEGSQPNVPYNLLVTREWMLAVPRSRDRYWDIPINSLGYAGSLLVRDGVGLSRLKAIGPLRLLTEVGYPARR